MTYINTPLRVLTLDSKGNLQVHNDLRALQNWFREITTVANEHDDLEQLVESAIEFRDYEQEIGEISSRLAALEASISGEGGEPSEPAVAFATPANEDMNEGISVPTGAENEEIGDASPIPVFETEEPAGADIPTTITEENIQLSDNTIGDASEDAHGFAPKIVAVSGAYGSPVSDHPAMTDKTFVFALNTDTSKMTLFYRLGSNYHFFEETGVTT